MRQPLSWRRGGAIALLVLLIVAAASIYLDNAGTTELQPVIDRMKSRGKEPAELVATIGRSARVVLLSDEHGQVAPKRVAASAIRAMASGAGLDAVVLEVPSDEQPYIDSYLASPDDNATVLLSRPAAVREADGTARAYLEIYRAVRAVNREVGAARRVGIIAADLPGWPPPEGTPPERVAAMYARRPAHMLRQLDERLLSINPEARLLVFVDGYLTLHGTRGELRSAGGRAQEVTWLGDLLRRRDAGDTRTVLLDAGRPGAGVLGSLPEYRGTALFRPLGRALGNATGMRVDESFDEVTDPVLTPASPGLTLEILPHGYTMHDIADGYVFLGTER